MNRTLEAQILDAEDRLRTAMLNSEVLSKDDDVAAHRSGILKLEELEPSEQQVRFNDVEKAAQGFEDLTYSAAAKA